MKAMTMLLPAMLLAACTATGSGEAPAPLPAPPAPEDDYSAIGTEPFWNLRIANGRMMFQPLEEPIVEVAQPAATALPNGRRYVTPELSVDITHAECNDGMSDRTYPDTVDVMAKKMRVKGCGGPAKKAAAVEKGPLEGTRWRVSSINNRGAQHSRLEFTADRLSGRSCNQFSGSYKIVGTTLVPGAIMATRMACDATVMGEETRLFAALKGPLKMRFGDTGALALTGPDGRSITLDRVE